MNNLVGYVKNISANPITFGSTTINQGIKSYVLLKSDFFSSNAGFLTEQFTRGNVEIYDTTDTLVVFPYTIINYTTDMFKFIQNTGFTPPIPVVVISTSATLSGYESFINVNSTNGAISITLPLLSNVNSGVQQIDIKNQVGQNNVSVIASGTDNISGNTTEVITPGNSLNIKPSTEWVNTSPQTGGVTRITSSIDESEWVIGSVYTKTITAPNTNPGDHSIITTSVSDEFMEDIRDSGRSLVTNSWCAEAGSLIVFAKIV